MHKEKFNTIYVEISSTCNATCPYCITGRNKDRHINPFMQTKKYSEILYKLLSEGYADKNTMVHLYVWGEPFLHPEFSRIMAISAEYPMKFALSTNASIRPEITKDFAKIHEIRFSCSGYTQESYDRVHGFNAKRIRDNIQHVIESMRKHGFNTKFHINFHIYQFNQEEVSAIAEFAKSLDVSILPNYAIINDWNLTNQWIQKDISVEDALAIGSDLFNFGPANLIKRAPKSYVCPQHNFLVLDSSGNICICCQTPHKEPYFSGNILDENACTAIAERQNNDICRNCIKIGCAYMFNNSLQPPFWAKEFGIKKSIIKSIVNLLWR